MTAKTFCFAKVVLLFRIGLCFESLFLEASLLIQFSGTITIEHKCSCICCFFVTCRTFQLFFFTSKFVLSPPPPTQFTLPAKMYYPSMWQHVTDCLVPLGAIQKYVHSERGRGTQKIVKTNRKVYKGEGTP